MKTIKRIAALLLAVVMLFSGIPMAELGIESIFATKASAVSLRYGDKLYGDFVYCYTNDSKNEIIIKKYMGNEKKVVVPDFIEGLPVIELYAYSFSINSNNLYSNPDCVYIESVILPDSVRTIESYAFEDCKNLQYIYLPKDLEVLGEGAFKNCSSLESLDFSQGCYSLAADVFYGTKIKDLVITSDRKMTDFFSYFLRGSSVENLTVKSTFLQFFTNSLENETLKTLTIDGTVGSFNKLTFGDVETANLPEEINIFDDFTIGVYSSLEKYGYSCVVSEENDLWWTFTKTDTEKEILRDGKFKYFLNAKGEAVLRRYEGSSPMIVPEKLGGATVTTIYWDFHCDEETVELPDTVTHIQGCAFSESKLTSISLGSGLKSIGYEAFKNCDSLTEITLPEGVTKISSYAFAECHKLKSINAKGVTSVRDSAFESCFKLSEIEFSEDFYYVGGYAFWGCDSLKEFKYDKQTTFIDIYGFHYSGIESFEFSNELTVIPEGAFESAELISITLPSNLEIIGPNAFNSCDNLEEIVIPETVKVIDNYAFAYCAKLNGEITISENVEKLGPGIFSNTNYSVLNYNTASTQAQNAFEETKLTTINFGNNVKAIPSSLVKSCKELKSITLSDSITKIGEEAFAHCTNLESVKMSDNITEIGDKAFYDCPNITELTIPKKVTELNANVFPKNLTTVYYNAENCTFKGLVKSSAEDTYYSPFYHTNVNKVVLGNTVKRIPNYFFSNVNFLETVILPDSVTEIGKESFRASSIKNVVLPASLIIIEERAFADTQVVIDGNVFPDGMRIIGKEAFENCNDLEEIYIPDSVVNIAENAFAGCKTLSKVRMSPNVKLISIGCFKGCSVLQSFVWESNVKLIADYAFANCKLLSEFDFTGVELLYPNSFTNTGVTVIALGEDKNEEATNLLSVEAQSFKSCTDLETLSIGGNVATIKSEAFADCSNLGVAVISNSVINIASDAFDGCNSLTIYCMENSYAHDYAVQNNIPVSTFVIAPIPNQTYTGNRIEPELDVSVSNKHLTENTDFTVKYADNINVGTAKVTVSGKGIYKVLTSIANFTIITKNIAPVTIAPVADQNYTGEAVTPSLTVTDGSNILREGTDYTVAYKNNVNTGTATATIQGIGNYSGTASVNFTILEQSLFERLLSAISTFFTTIVTWLQALFSFKIK